MCVYGIHECMDICLSVWKLGYVCVYVYMYVYMNTCAYVRPHPMPPSICPFSLASFAFLCVDVPSEPLPCPGE